MHSSSSFATPVAYEIRAARPVDLPKLSAIELAAARLLVGFAPESVLVETTPHADLDSACREGTLWVAVADDEAIGFAHVKRVEIGSAHLDELDVHPAHGRRGVGRRLVGAVCDWAAVNGLQAVTLSTFRDPPWNRPFYARLGFEVVPDDELSRALSAIVADESRRGLDLSRRVVMRRQLHER